MVRNICLHCWGRALRTLMSSPPWVSGMLIVSCIASILYVHPGTLVLQDLEPVIAQAKLKLATSISALGLPTPPATPGSDTEIRRDATVPDSTNIVPGSTIYAIPHDFFTPQPVRHAQAYYIHACLHDWPDAQCRVILGHIRDAMRPGYSKLLINEVVLPDTGAAHWEFTGLDLLMMGACGSKERTAEEWRALVESVGLRVEKIWEVGRGVEGLIECAVAED